MNTKQNPVGVVSYANQPTNRTKKNAKTVSNYLSQKLSFVDSQKCLYWLWTGGQITEKEYERGTLIQVLDNGMHPQLSKGGKIAFRLLDPNEYESVKDRIVAISVKSNPDKYIIGQLTTVDNLTIKLSFENVSFPDVFISRREIFQVFEGICIYSMPLV